MALKWKQVASGTIVSLFFVLAGILNLSGVSHSDDGDKVCTDCYSEIKVKSTYWEIRVTYAGEDKDSIFKKRTRSRTLWVNLDKIEELVTTNPKIKVDILVPTISKYSIMKHKEYGYLRPLKEGDTLIKRNTKSRPSPSRIILHGTKEATQTVKWNFNLEHWLMEDINIDPVWLATSNKFTEEIEIKPNIFKINRCKNLSRTEYITCFNNRTDYINYIFINNKTGINESRTDLINYSKPYNCKPYKVYYKANCKTIGIETDKIKITCPPNTRCDVIGTEWCMVDLADGDKHYDAKQYPAKGWSRVCTDVDDLKQGMEIKVSNFKKTSVKVEKLSVAKVEK